MTKQEILVEIKNEILKIAANVADYSKLDILLEDLHQDGYEYGYDEGYGDCTDDQ